MRKGNITFRFLAGTLLIAGVGFSILSAFPISSFPDAKVRLSFDHFYDHGALTKALKDLEKEYPDFMTVRSIGKSVMGRDIWAVILNNPKTGPEIEKPGYYIDGNIHGNEIQGAEVALYVVYFLLENYGKTDLATRLLDEKTFYIVPTMNPDSRDWYIHKPAMSGMPRSGLVPFDEDRDGVVDEDGMDDLDGDGSITMMRRKDPLGRMKRHPSDPRILIPIKPGEKGEYTMLGFEGIDNDGDGLVNEDGPGGYDMNRNFGYGWQPEYVQNGSGGYPFCFPETQAVRDFLLAHPNIMGAQSFHNSGGMILRGPGAKSLGNYDSIDNAVYDFVGKRGEEILPGYRYMTIYRDLYEVYGGSLDFMFSTLGIYTFSNELDTDMAMTEKAPKNKRGGGKNEGFSEEAMSDLTGRQIDEMRYLDLVLLGQEYTDWKPFKHPFYGDIEIGGQKKFSNRVPPLFKLAETCHRNAAFCLYHADQLPRLAIDAAEARKTGKDIYEISIKLSNSRVTPSISSEASRKRLHRQDIVRIEGKNVELLAAGRLTDPFRNRTYAVKTIRNEFRAGSGIPGFGNVEYRIMVKGSGEITIVYDSLKGGKIFRRVRLS